ncbi:MAG: TonB-dependent receptor [Bacteroidales bacterium]|nr:TonB-dependent receptor [Bacteroidales bacterium]
MKLFRFRMYGLILLHAIAWSKTVETFAETKKMVYEQNTESSASFSDSLPVYHIGEVMIVKDMRDVEINSTSPFQLLNRNELKNVNSLQVSDAVKFFSGVTVKDFGGMGGMKTVSVRSMGAHHTAVAYDGITITDCQTGQIDIGRYSLDNVDILSLNIGDGNTIFQPARMFASSVLLTIRTRRPEFKDGKSFHGDASFKAGSFGLLNPSLLLETKLNPLFNLSLSAEVMCADGDYPYKLYYADASNAYTTEIRSNNAMKTYRLESTLFGQFKKGQKLEVKAYYYQSDRGLPGAVILYNPYSSQQLWDRNFFTQVHYEQNFSSKIVFQANGKYNRSYQRYLNPDYLGSTGEEDNSYHQDESYLSSSFLYNATGKLSFAFSTDGVFNQMRSNLYGFAEPSRYTVLADFSAKYLNDWMVMTTGILGTSIHEERASAEVAENHQRLSPAFSLSVQPFSEENLHLRMFCKESFRMPSFNDLYYTAVGNSQLKPENSKQMNLGMTYNVSLGKRLPELMMTIDGYHNMITDKIMAIPTKNIFIWSMVNLGKVDIKGLDLAISVKQSLGKDFSFAAGLNHSYQRALDVTDITDAEYKNQIAYSPRIYGSGRLSLETPWLNIAYAILYSGHRYVTGQNLAENDLAGYTDHSISVERTFEVCGQTLNLRSEVLNLLDKNYEIVRNFPMPGRSYRFGIKFEF